VTLNNDIRGFVIGLDLSLTGTGVAIIGHGGVSTGLIKSKGRKGDSLAQRRERLRSIVRDIGQLIPNDSLVVVEQPAYSQTGGSHHDRSGLWWLVVELAIDWGFDVVEVTPGGVKKYATGSGNASKDTVLAAVVKRYLDVDVTDNNVADALTLAAMGARYLGFPLEASLPQINLAAMDAVRWNDAAPAAEKSTR
jgi:crossover junction endodeoxyribonuclease RuvC